MKRNILLLKYAYMALAFLCIQACKDKQETESKVVTPQEEKIEATNPSTNNNKRTILCFGNSLTAGYGIDEDQAWPALLQKRLDSLKTNYNVVNAGLSGETTSGGLNRIDWVLKNPVDIFILELGANDMLRGIDVKSTEENLDSIIRKVQTKYPECKVVIAGMLAAPNMGYDYTKVFNDIFPRLAMKHKTNLIPFFLDEVAGIAELNLADGKHPNPEGQKIVLDNVWPSVKPHIQFRLK